MNELLARFGHRFIDSARQRLQEVPELTGAEPAKAAHALALHLHSISGEAAMIGLAELSEQARTAMRAARAVEAGGAPEPCVDELARLTRLFDELERTLSAPTSR